MMEQRNSESHSSNENTQLENSSHENSGNSDNSGLEHKENSSLSDVNHKSSFRRSFGGSNGTSRKSAFQSILSYKHFSKQHPKNRFEIIRELKIVPIYDNKKNYYFEYLNIFNENEIILEKIKQSTAEIQQLRTKIELSSQNK
jgi:hypothetical protein